MPSPSSSSSPAGDPLAVPLLPVSSFDRVHTTTKPSSSTPSKPRSPPSTTHRSATSSRLPPRRGIVWTGLALVALFLLGTYIAPSASNPDNASSISAKMAWRNPEAAAADPARAEPQRVDPSSCGAASSPPEDLEDRFERARRPLPEHATLGERLAAWELDAPGWGVEGADWVRKSDQVRFVLPSSPLCSPLLPSL